MAIAVDLVPVLVAMVALAIVVAGYFVAEALAKFLQDTHINVIPIVGGALMTAVNAIAGWLGTAATWLWQNANPINLLMAGVHWLLGFFMTITQWLATSIYNAIQYLYHVALNQVLQTAIGIADDLYNQAMAAVNNAEATAVGIAENLYNLSISAVNAAEATAIGIADDLYNEALDALSRGIDNVTSYIDQQIGQLTQAIDGAIGNVWGYINGSILPAIAAAAAAAAAVAVDWGTWKAECGEPLCNNLGTFGSELNALETALSEGVIIALLVEAVSNPQGAAGDIVSVIAQPIEDAASLIGQLVGLQTAA